MNRRTILIALLLFLVALPLIALAGGFRDGLSGGSPSGISPDGSQINTLDSIGGSLVNKYGVWTFGPGVTGPTAANPPGPFGSFNYAKLNGRVINQIGLFGITGRTGASQIVVNYGGEVFFLTTENDRIWYQYVDYTQNSNVSGSACPPCTVDPTLVVHAAGPNALPPFTPSAPGTTVTSSPGCVTSIDGVWCAPGGTGWQPTLNGIPFNAVGAVPYNSMTVACSGNIFQLNANDGLMYTVLSFNTYPTSSGSSLPTCPIPINVAVTPNPALVSGSIPGPQLTSATTGVIASFVVTTSDGSPYSGSTFLDTTASFLGISGTNIVTTASPSPPGNYFVEVRTASGVGSPGASTIEVIVH
jgi:hypothetical protein